MMLLQGVLLGGLGTVHGDMEKKICTVGYGKLLCEHPALLQKQDVWGKTLEVSIFTAMERM